MGKDHKMKQTRDLFDVWTELEEEANLAILDYDAGEREEGMERFRSIWQRFRENFGSREARSEIGDMDFEIMSMVLERMYWDMADDGEDQLLWEFCQEVCGLFEPGELWTEEYVDFIGRTLQARGQYAACDEWFQSRIRLEPDRLEHAARWAACLADRQENERAAEILRRAMEQAPKCTLARLGFYRKARKVFLQMKQTEEAEVCRQRICELDEDYLIEDEE